MHNQTPEDHVGAPGGNRPKPWKRFARVSPLSGLAKGFFLAAGLAALLFPTQSPAAEDFETLPLSPPYAVERFGTSIFFPTQGRDGAKIVTPGRKHLEIDKFEQHLRAYDEEGRKVLDALVSTGKPGTDEKRRERSETLSGIHRVFEVRPFRRWSKDPKVKMLNWIGIVPGVEKGIHSLEPIGEFADYEKLLGQKASHGCIRLDRKDSEGLVKWIGDAWKTYPLIVYIYDKPVRRGGPLPESRYLLLLIVREGSYRYEPLSREVPTVRRGGKGPTRLMTRGSFLLYRKEGEAWGLIGPSEAK